MTDIAPSQIPSTALPATNGTVEQLVAWCLLLLKAANGTDSAVEVSGAASSQVVQQQVFQQPDGTYRLLVRLNLQLNENYITDDTAPLWTFAEELTTGAPPANYVV